MLNFVPVKPIYPRFCHSVSNLLLRPQLPTGEAHYAVVSSPLQCPMGPICQFRCVKQYIAGGVAKLSTNWFIGETKLTKTSGRSEP
jgi:hypothetical protein